MEYPIIKVFVPAIMAFVIGLIITPLITHYLFKYKVWKKQGGKTAMGGHVATEFNRLKGDGEVKTPRMGGIVIWASVLLTIVALGLIETIFPASQWASVYFLSRAQTWIPVAALIIGAGIGFLNDYYDVVHGGKGLSLRIRLIIISVLAGGIGYWFYAKLGVDAIGIPFDGALYVGWLIVPFFIFLTISLYASGVIDGIDGLSGGVFTAIFLSYAGVAFVQSQYDIAALCATIAGGILAFLWFNIPPARFYMGETGMMALTLTLSTIAFLTDSVLLLPIIAFPLFITSLVAIIQMISRKFFGRKVFRVALLHNYFELIGWSRSKITMRYWIVGVVTATIGVVLGVIS